MGRVRNKEVCRRAGMEGSFGWTSAQSDVMGRERNKEVCRRARMDREFRLDFSTE